MYKRARGVAELLPSHWPDFILEQVNDATRSQSRGCFDAVQDCTWSARPLRWTSRLHTAVTGDVVYLGMSI